MFTLIKAARLFAPEDRGEQDILIAGGTIAKIAARIAPPQGLEVRVIESEGRLVVPGFIDLHVHLIGGGGEGGFSTRTPEIRLSRIARAGVTTVVGCLGTDDLSRTPEALLAKALQLEEEGVSTYIYTGSYQFPPATITGSIRKDLAFIPKVIGVGEIAVSDHRSSQPTFEELCRVAAQARVGGMIGGKAGLVHLHVGDGARGLDLLFRLLEETEIPAGQFLPTHVNRNERLLEESIKYALRGGNIDFTVLANDFTAAWPVRRALETALQRGVPIDRITLSSDSNGSFPVFDQEGRLVGLEVADIVNLYEEFRKLAASGFPLEQALRLVTVNPARRIGISSRKGSIEEGKDADLLILDRGYNIEAVLAKGRLLVEGGAPVVRGVFEQE